MDKLFIASDVHGSAYYAQLIVNEFVKSGADCLVLLGDTYNHGPRNPLTKDYAPLKVAELFNALAARVIAIKGNCECEADESISDFPIVKNKRLTMGKRTVFLTHGHVFNENNLPKLKQNDVLCHGHTHVSYVEKKDGIYFINPGSVSLPKDEFRGYMLLEKERVTKCGFDGTFIEFAI